MVHRWDDERGVYYSLSTFFANSTSEKLYSMKGKHPIIISY